MSAEDVSRQPPANTAPDWYTAVTATPTDGDQQHTGTQHTTCHAPCPTCLLTALRPRSRVTTTQSKFLDPQHPIPLHPNHICPPQSAPHGYLRRSPSAPALHACANPPIPPPTPFPPKGGARSWGGGLGVRASGTARRIPSSASLPQVLTGSGGWVGVSRAAADGKGTWLSRK